MTSEAFKLGILNLSRNLNNFNLPDAPKESFVRFFVGDKSIGFINKKDLFILKNYNNLFHIGDEKVLMNPALKSFDERTEAFEKVLLDLKEKKAFKVLDGWRNEHYYVRSRFSENPLFKIERSSVHIFGIKAYGCHINGYIKKNNQYHLWIARRSKSKPTYPNMLDNFVAGGLTAGLSLIDCAKKELEEEAGIGSELSSNLKSVNAISYAFINKHEHITNEGEFVFDIKLPLDYIPLNNDGEVDNFYLMDVEQVKKAIISDEFKPNSAAVTLDFLFRKGQLNPDEIPHYLEILENIHAPGL